MNGENRLARDMNIKQRKAERGVALEEIGIKRDDNMIGRGNEWSEQTSERHEYKTTKSGKKTR